MAEDRPIMRILGTLRWKKSGMRCPVLRATFVVATVALARCAPAKWNSIFRATEVPATASYRCEALD